MISNTDSLLSLKELRERGEIGPVKAGHWLERWQQKSLSRAVMAVVFNGGCCADQVRQALGYLSFYDLKESTMNDEIRLSQADILIIAGHVSLKAWPFLWDYYQKMNHPKYIIHVGTCALSGGLFRDGAVVTNLPERLPADVVVPGCPVHPHAVCQAINTIQERIESGLKARGAIC